MHTVLLSASCDFLVKHSIGEHSKEALGKAAEVCQKGLETGWGTKNRFKAITDKSLHDCAAFSKTCFKVSSVGLILSYLPFFIGTMGSSCALFFATLGLLTFDVMEIIEQLSKLDQKDALVTGKFNELTEQSARIEFLVRTTFILGLLPTHMVEKVGFILGLPLAEGQKFRNDL